MRISEPDLNVRLCFTRNVILHVSVKTAKFNIVPIAKFNIVPIAKFNSVNAPCGFAGQNVSRTRYDAIKMLIIVKLWRVR